MARERVSITIEPTMLDSTMGQTMTVAQNGTITGQCFVPTGQALVPVGLLLAGFSTVVWGGPGWVGQTLSLDLWCREPSSPDRRVSPALNGHRGTVELKKFWVEGKDECMLDVLFNGVGAWGWATPDLSSVEVLAHILREAPLDVTIERLATVVYRTSTPSSPTQDTRLDPRGPFLDEDLQAA